MDAPAACRHCGIALTSPTQGGFCCAGCRTAHEVISACGLDAFYRLRRDEPGRPVVEASSAASPWLDGEAFAARHCHAVGDGRQVVRWRVEGVHCSACVWLLEHLPRLDAGIIAARVDLASDALTVVFTRDCPPSRQVALAARLGYGLRPHRGSASPAVRRSELLRLVVSLASATGAMHVVMNLLAGGLTGDLDAASRQVFAWLSIPVAAPALTYGAWPFWTGAVAALRMRRLTLDVITALVLAVAIGASLVHLGRGGDIYLDAAAMFVALLLAGRAAAAAAKRAALRRLGGLDGLLPEHAVVRSADGNDRSVAVESLAPGDLVVVPPGSIVPCDGVVEGASGRISAAVLTGESRSLVVAAGDAIWAGSVNRGEALLLRATACGEDTRVGGLLDRAKAIGSAERSPSERWHGWFAALILLAAAATWLLWIRLDPARALDQTVAMVLALCPCALGIGVPLVHAVATARAARRGVVIRDAEALSRLAVASDIVFDKTGTLTSGEPVVVAWETVGDASALAVVLAGESRSRHPVAAALADRLRADGIVPADLDAGAWREEPGRGIVVSTILGDVRVGTPEHAGVPTWTVPADAAPVAATINGQLILRAAVGDGLKPGIGAVLDQVRRSGARIHLLSGDDARVVERVGATLAIPPACVRGGALPETKHDYVRGLVAAGGTVAMVGDGINDAAALGASQVGIGVRGGLAACLERCDIVCLDGTAEELVAVLRGAQRMQATIRACLALALVYNLVAAGLVIAGAWGPLVCAIAMPASSLSVLLLALAGRAFRR